MEGSDTAGESPELVKCQVRKGRDLLAFLYVLLEISKYLGVTELQTPIAKVFEL